MSPGLVPAKDVACSANGSDGIGLVTLREQPSQPADMDVDGPVIDIRRLAPNVVEELGPGENAPLVFHEEFKKPIFGGAKSYLASMSVRLNLPSSRVTDLSCACSTLRFAYVCTNSVWILSMSWMERARASF